MLDFLYKMCRTAIILRLIADDLVMADLYCVYLISTLFSESTFLFEFLCLWNHALMLMCKQQYFFYNPHF